MGKDSGAIDRNGQVRIRCIAFDSHDPTTAEDEVFEDGEVTLRIVSEKLAMTSFEKCLPVCEPRSKHDP